MSGTTLPGDISERTKSPRPALLSIDPSSTTTGYALFQTRSDLTEAGVFKPNRVRDDPYERITAMMGDMLGMIYRLKPRRLVIEMPSGKPGHGSRKGAKTSLIIYGAAAGAFFGAARVAMGGEAVTPVLENVWTGGTPKATRLAVVGSMYPEYLRMRNADPGGDAGDAIGLGDWFLTP